MSTISGINFSNLFNFPSNPLSSNSQASDNPNSTGTPNKTNSTSSIAPLDIVRLNLLQTNEIALSLLNPSYSPSAESLILSMETLQTIEQTGVMKSHPELAKSLLSSTQSPSSLESLASSMNILQFIEPSNVSETNPDLVQSLLQGIMPSLSNVDMSATVPSGSPDNTQVSPLLTNPDTTATSLQPYLDNTLLSELLGSMINQTI